MACAASGGEAGDAETATTTSAVIVVERTTDVTQGLSAEATARFVRATGATASEAAIRSVGAALDLPAAGSCSTLSALAGEASAEAPTVLELLDVGPVTLEANGAATRLLPRQLPDVTDVVSGVVYARSTEGTSLPASAGYLLHVTGGAALGAVDVGVSAPADASEVRILNADAPAGGIAVGNGVSLEWTDDGAADQVYVDVRPSGVRCLLDGGRGLVPGAFFDDAGTISVHRLHREAIHARGIDTGEVRFDFARVVPYVGR
jgi:hypothetical protein